MAQVKDPVCGMTVDTDSAAATSRFEGETYYFCSTTCARQFDADPRRYAEHGGTVRASTTTDEPVGDAPHTTTGKFTAPKFGSAGSGGAEYEPLPKDDDRNAPRR